MRNLINKIKNYFKFKAIILKTKIKYYMNKRTGQPIFWFKQESRHTGKTTLIIKDAIKYKIPIIVETRNQKLCMLQLAKKMNKSLKIYTAYENLDGMKINEVLLDCAGRGWEVIQERYPNIKIMNGFVYDN